MVKINCKSPIFVNNVLVPCGSCFSCRNKYRNQWRLRLQHELLSYDNNAMFLTLTYNDENLPEDHSLVKRDVQLFIKRLRKYYSDITIKYFAVGEYGDRKKRPHYHLIIYGLSAPENKRNSQLNFKYGKFLAEKIWQKGFCYVGYANSKTITYVSKYVLKNFTKDISKDDFEKAGMEPPFSLKSIGLGLSWLMEHIDEVKYNILNNKLVTLYKSKTSYPRYYRKKLIEFGHFPEDFFANRYYEEMDKVQSSIIQELHDAYINLDPVKNYFDIPLSQLANIDKIVKYSYKDIVVSPKRYTKDFFVKKIDIIPDVDKIRDIYENHWFFVYKRYCSSVNDFKEKKYKLLHKDKIDFYE